MANNTASSTAGVLNQNAQLTMAQETNQNSILSQQETLFNGLYSAALTQAQSILGGPVYNAGKLTGKTATYKTGPQGDVYGAQTAKSSLMG